MSEALKELIEAHTLRVDPDTQRRRNDVEAELFPIEKSGSAGQALLKELRCSSDTQYPEFLPEGLAQTYRDARTGLDLPVFAIFPLNSQTNTITSQIEVQSDGTPKVVFHPALHGLASFSGLARHLVPTASVNSVMRRNRVRERLLIRPCYVFLAFGFVLAPCIVALRLDPTVQLTLLLSAIVAVCITLPLLSWQLEKRLSGGLRLVAAFEALLPKTVRQKAKQIAGEFTDLFLVVDQRGRWESELLPIPEPANADPLLIGSRKVGSSWCYYLIEAFDLTNAEQYLQDEFCGNPGSITAHL